MQLPARCRRLPRESRFGGAVRSAPKVRSRPSPRPHCGPSPRPVRRGVGHQRMLVEAHTDQPRAGRDVQRPGRRLARADHQRRDQRLCPPLAAGQPERRQRQRLARTHGVGQAGDQDRDAGRQVAERDLEHTAGRRQRAGSSGERRPAERAGTAQAMGRVDRRQAERRSFSPSLAIARRHPRPCMQREAVDRRAQRTRLRRRFHCSGWGKRSRRRGAEAKRRCCWCTSRRRRRRVGRSAWPRESAPSGGGSCSRVDRRVASGRVHRCVAPP